MKKVDHADSREVARAANESGLARLLGLKIIEAGRGRAAAEMTIGEGHLNFYGLTHGAALYALADHVCSVAGNSLGRPAVMSQSTAYFLGNPKVGRTVTARGRVTVSGRTLGHIEVEITGEGDKVLLKFTASIFFLDKEPR
jgi:acyl-CoA thioesterase